jgi:glycogenin glucosyltransferase
VYDRHYRAVQPAPSPLDFELQRYDSAWDDGISIGAEVVPSAALQASVGSTWAGSHGSAHLQALPGVGGYPSQVQASGPLGLNELRRLAAEGVDGIFFASASLKPEGEYRRLPLDGRIDLMRPKRELSPSILDVEDISGGETPRQASFPADLTRMVTLPTPDASELPPAPRPHHAALPGMRRRHQRVHDPHAEHGPHSSDSGLDGDWMDQPPFPGHKRNRSSPPRAMSPPKITWNPATDPPPNNPPPQSAFPTETYFANAWDKPQTRSNDAVFQPFSLEAPKFADGPFFRAPPSAAIPETLIREGHYSNIVDHGQSVQPDPNKVKAVFPWEEQPRRAPSRSFPKSESPPRDTKYIKEKSMASPVASSGPRPPMHHTISSSLSDPSKFNFSNAWDSVPSIRKYATKLARPGQATPPHVPSFDDSEYHRERARLERQEAGRNDADDEDEGDDEDSMDERSSRDRSRSASNDRYRYEEDEDESHTPAYRPSTSKPRHARIRSGHNSPVHAPFIVKKEYRTQGVQTSFLEPEITSVQRNSFGVQVDTPDVLTSRPSSRTHSRASSRSAGDVRRTSFSNKLPTSRQGSSEDVRGRTESLPVRRDRTPLSLSRIGPLAPSAFIRSESRRTSGGKASPLIQSSPGNSSPQPSSSPTDAPPALRRHKLGSLSSEMLPVGLGLGRPDNLVFPRRIEREVSGDSIETNTTSPPESLATPTTPYGEFDPASYGSAGRKSGRQWNPNTGVDVFKRSSEEVLSRFLRQGSWDGDEPAPHLSSPGPTNSR